jgi:hypothetical protein
MAGLKSIPAVIKISDETDSMVDSYLENAQREDLSPEEKENALISLWRTGRFQTPRDLDKALGYQTGYSGTIIEARGFREKHDIPHSITTSTIVSTKGLGDELRRRLLMRVARNEGKFGQVRTVRELKAIIERAPEGVAEKILEDSMEIDEAKKVVDLYEEATKKRSFTPLASAIADGDISTQIAERTMRLYDKLEQQGVSLDPNIITQDVEEIKRQHAMDMAHEKLVEDARVAVLSRKKSSVDFQVEDPGGSFVREVSDVAWRVQRWGVQILMSIGAQRWKEALKYFQEIDSRMHFLLGYNRSDSIEAHES